MNAKKKPSDALLRIKDDFLIFCEGVERCRIGKSEGNFKRGDLQDAYGRLYTLFDRYKVERQHLSKTERKLLSQVFEQDIFIKNLTKLDRNIATHVTKNSAPGQEHHEGRHKSGSPFTIPVETSARNMFGSSVVNLGGTVTIDHLDNLETAEKRIAARIEKLSA